MRRLLLVIVTLLALGSAGACVDLSGLSGGDDEMRLPDRTTVGDASRATPRDVVDASRDAAGDASLSKDSLGYAELGDRSRWSTYETVKAEWSGSAFDGRYLYVVSDNATTEGVCIVMRLATTEPKPKSEPSFFSPVAIDPRALGYHGAVFDGRYVYLVPDKHGGLVTEVLVRYDTSGAFDQAASWTSYALPSLIGGDGYRGGIFDGRYVYFVSASPRSTGVLRYDTTQPFQTKDAWSLVGNLLAPGKTLAYRGAVFDGRHLYLVPSVYEAATGALAHGFVIRYDTQQPFDTATSWSAFDVSAFDALAKGYAGGVFDGRYVYLVPHEGTYARLARFDTKGSLSSAASWTFVELTSVGAKGTRNYHGAVFDGRHVYLAPYGTAPIARLDTLGAITDEASWSFHSSFDAFVVGYRGFQGAAFDGQNVTFLSRGGRLVRFDAKRPPSMPPGYGSSFF